MSREPFVPRATKRRAPFDSTATLSVTVSLEALLEQFRYMDRDEVIEFVKALDASMQEWDFTLPLCDHFAALKKEWEQEQVTP